MDIRENLINTLNGKENEKTPVTAFPSVLTMELLLNANTTFDEANHDAQKMAQVSGSLYDYIAIKKNTYKAAIDAINNR